jgi:hypothetical protein
VTRRARSLVVSALALAAGALAAGCDTKKGEYQGDADTGAAAPATVRDMSETKQAPDSTAGVARATGQPGISGDTTGRRKETDNPTRKVPGKTP